MSQITSIAVGLSIPVVILFGIFALYISTSAPKHEDSAEFFLSAKNSQSTARIAWSYYAAAVGACVVFAPSSFVVDPVNGAGWLGLISMSFFTALGVLVVVYAGAHVRQKYPNAISLGQYCNHRFGRPVEIYVTAIVFFNLAIGRIVFAK